ncbi:hypothetical protein LZ30DRAFT_560678, partial [Colletotrichum cereale]
RDDLAKQENILYLEIETAKLMNHIACMVIKEVCKYFDYQKNYYWQVYAALDAADFGKALI